jgi:hypothetical protein
MPIRPSSTGTEVTRASRPSLRQASIASRASETGRPDRRCSSQALGVIQSARGTSRSATALATSGFT